MGAATSVNSTDIVTKSVNSIIGDIVQEMIINNNQSAIIKVEDTDGDVEISDVNVNQKFNVNMEAIFSSLTETSNNNKINQQIEQIAKSLISGLNVAQVSVSTSTLNSIIDNCINIKNNAIETCRTSSEQVVEISVVRSKKDVKINNINIEQIGTNILRCITNAKNNEKIINDTDVKIKQLSSATAEGLDFKWIIVAVIASVGGLGIAGKSILSTLLGPLIAIFGGGLFYYTSQKKTTKSSVIYILNNNLPEIPNDGPLKSDEIIMNFGGNTKRYSSTNVQTIVNSPNEIKCDSISYDLRENELYLRVKNSSIYKVKTFTFPSEIKTVEIIQDKNQEKINEKVKDKKPGDVVMDCSNIEFSHKIVIYFGTEIMFTHYFEPTAISYVAEPEPISFKNPVIILSVVLMVFGIIITILNLVKNKN